MENLQMNPERMAVVVAMKAMGWQVERCKAGNAKLKFSRPDTGGLWDVIVVPKQRLSILWLAEIAEKYGDAPQNVDAIIQIRRNWFFNRFGGLLEDGYK